MREGLRNVATGANAIELKHGIDKASEFLVEKIAEHARTVEDSLAIAQVGLPTLSPMQNGWRQH